MVIGNGFINKTLDDAIREMTNRAKGQVYLIPLPMIPDHLHYYITVNALIYSSQKYKDFYLSKELKISNRYSIGPTFRYTQIGKKEKQMTVSLALYLTFVLGRYEEDVNLLFKDGNPYHISLDNIERKGKELPPFFNENMYALKDLYTAQFANVTWFVYYNTFPSLSTAEAEDIASDSFLEMCNTHELRADDAYGLWLHIARNRGRDSYRSKKECYGILWDNGEEKYGIKPFNVEVDLTSSVVGNKRRRYLEMWMQSMKHTEIAEELGRSPQSVSSEVSRALAQLKKEYKNDIKIYHNDTDNRI